MEKWKKFEISCYKYLKKRYSIFVGVKDYGRSDSTKPDVIIEKSDGDNFFIEIKSSKAQCCQFVLFPNMDTEKFDLSTKNQVPDSKNKDEIISYMNDNFDIYKQVYDEDIAIPIEKDILYGLVTDFYVAKKVKYFLTKGKDYIIFPLDKFSDYFEISAVYREKGSGSKGLPKCRCSELLNEINRKNIKGTFDFQFIGNNLRCFFHSEEDSLNKMIIKCGKYKCLFVTNDYSKEAVKLSSYTYIYEIRQLSNTYNPTVICVIKLKKGIQDEIDIIDFENEIKEV